MGSTEFNAGGNPAVDLHLIQAMETGICSEVPCHRFELLAFF